MKGTLKKAKKKTSRFFSERERERAGKNVVKMKLKTNTSLLVLYVCYWPGLEDRSSGPGIVSRSLSRGEFASLSSKHGFFLAREKSSSTLGVSRTESSSIF